MGAWWYLAVAAFGVINEAVAVIAIGTHAIALHRCYHLYM